jgi:hypothetical protein
MLVTEEGISVEGGGFDLPELTVADYRLGGVRGWFATDTNSGFLIVGAEGSLGIPNLANVSIGFRLDSSCPFLLKEFCLAAGDLGTGIPIGTTGMFLTDIGGCVTEMSPDGACDNNWQITINVSIASSTIQIPLINKKAVQGDVQLRISWGTLHGEGVIYLAGYQLANGYFDLSPTAFHAHGGFAIPPEPYDWFSASADIWIKWQPRLSFYGEAQGSLVVPGSYIAEHLWLWDQDVEIASFDAGFDRRGLYGEFKVLDFIRLAIELLWNGQAIVGGNLDQRGHYDKGKTRTIGVRRVAKGEGVDTVTVEVLDKDQEAIFYIGHSVESAIQMTLVRPDFLVLDSASVDAFARQGESAFFQVLDPPPGIWSMVVENPESDNFVVDLFAVNSKPELTLLSPSDTTVNSTDSVFIQWDAPDPEGDSLTFSIYYRIDTASSSAVLVADSIKDTDSFYFQPGALPSGTYEILVHADDGYNSPTPCDNPGTFTVLNSDPPGQSTLQLPMSGDRSTRLKWTPNSAPDLLGYILYWAEKDSTSLDSLDVGGGTSYLLKNLQNDVLYRFGLKAYDYDGNTSDMSTWMYGMPTDIADATPPLIPQCSLIVDNIPASIGVTWPQVDDAAGYLIYYDTDPRLPYSGTGLSEGDSPIDVFNNTILTLSGLNPGAETMMRIG